MKEIEIDWNLLFSKAQEKALEGYDNTHHIYTSKEVIDIINKAFDCSKFIDEDTSDGSI
jgi:hypothetical protein